MVCVKSCKNAAETLQMIQNAYGSSALCLQNLPMLSSFSLKVGSPWNMMPELDALPPCRLIAEH